QPGDSLARERSENVWGSPISSTKLSRHSSRNAKLRPNSKTKLSSSDTAKRWQCDGSQIQVPETPSSQPPAQRNAFRLRDVHQQSRLFARLNPRLRHSPNSNRLC